MRRRRTRFAALGVAVIVGVALAVVLVPSVSVPGFAHDTPAAESAGGAAPESAVGPAIATLTSPSHPQPDVWYANDAPAFAWSVASGRVATYAWQIDRAPDAEPGEAKGGSTSASFTGLDDGFWYFHVRAADDAGRWGPTSTLAVCVDTTPPATSVSAPAGWSRHPVKLRLVPTDASSGVLGTEYSLDDGASWLPGTNVTVAAPSGHGNDGVHDVLFRSTDAAGNIEPARTARVAIDTRAPRLLGLRLSPSVVTGARPPLLRVAARDLSDRIRLSYRLLAADGKVVVAHRGFVMASGSRTLRVPMRYRGGDRLVPGLYRLALNLSDPAGNHVTAPVRVLRDLRPARAAVYRSLPAAGRRVALCFDDGYDRRAWASILATLRSSGLRATFFVNGCHVAESPDLARRTVAQGNTVGSHTWSHTVVAGRTAAQVASELRRDIQVWWRVARATPAPYFRPPAGSYDRTTLRVAGAEGFPRVILWNVDPSDYTRPGSAAITQRVLAHVSPGSIVCLHLLPQTAEALPAIIRGLRARGYAVVTLPALFRAAGRH